MLSLCNTLVVKAGAKPKENEFHLLVKASPGGSGREGARKVFYRCTLRNCPRQIWEWLSPMALWIMLFKWIQLVFECLHHLWYICHSPNPGQYRVPTWTGKPAKNGKAFSSQGKVREFWTDWKSQGKLNKILENSRNFRQMLFIIFSDI